MDSNSIRGNHVLFGTSSSSVPRYSDLCVPFLVSFLSQNEAIPPPFETMRPLSIQSAHFRQNDVHKEGVEAPRIHQPDQTLSAHAPQHMLLEHCLVAVPWLRRSPHHPTYSTLLVVAKVRVGFQHVTKGVPCAETVHLGTFASTFFPALAS